MMVPELHMQILLIKTVQSIFAKMYILYIFLLRYYKENTQLVGLFFTKGVVEFVVKILDKYTYRFSKNSFLKLKYMVSEFDTAHALCGSFIFGCKHGFSS